MPSGNQLSSIQHIVVLMLENRSFDHMLGFLYTDKGNKSPAGQALRRIDGKESNPNVQRQERPRFQDQADRQERLFHARRRSRRGLCCHQLRTLRQHQCSDAAGRHQPRIPQRLLLYDWWEAKEKWAILPGTVAQNIMGIFTPEMLPVLSSLARGYAVCDHWYSSVPTETMPNRAFANAATSQGHLDDETKTSQCQAFSAC